ncbi:ribose-phosphate diphosphokinase [Alkalibacterium sp. AK22]|uniref:ribose-phosphate diphosphokinase n=1 Tax=Alkalibacterium sp. AK22 TaxID=1229520 RepID=UPI001E5D3153|nr:ribose-phosphate pyrophosphokinase [Alkalibacterium sp. AK22]
MKMNQASQENLKIFALNSNRPLAEEVTGEMGLELGAADITRFQDGEIRINVEESIRGKDVYLIQSTNDPGNDNIMELLIMIDAIKRASARTINAIIPYYGYARQDRKPGPRQAITAKVLANMLTLAGADRVVAMELHSPQIQGFFDIPVDHLSATALMANHLIDRGYTAGETVVVSPDHAGVSRAREMAELLDCPLAIIDKRTTEETLGEDVRVVGEVEGCNCILFDDIMDTAKTVARASAMLKEAGAQKVYVCATHPVLSGKAVERIDQSGIEKAIVANTIDIGDKASCLRIEVVSVAPILADAIKRIQGKQSIKPLFDKSYLRNLEAGHLQDSEAE